MSKRNEIAPRTDRQGVVPIKRDYTRFYGALRGTPDTVIDLSHCFRNINVVDMRKYFRVRAGTRPYSTTAAPSGTINAGLDHDQAGVVVALFGSTVYVADKALSTYTSVLNIESISPSGVGMLDTDEQDAILFCSNGIWRIVLSDDFYWMYRINGNNIQTLITDVNESSSLVYGYHYSISRVRLSGSGNRGRTTDGVTIKFESATNQRSGDKDFGEVFFANPIGDDLTQNHIIGDLTLDDDDNLSNRFGVYRTLNIGENSGGVDSSVRGIGNNAAQMVWCEDVPVAKAFHIEAIDAVTREITLKTGNIDFEYADVGCTLSDRTGLLTGVIESFDGTTAIMQAGYTIIPGGPPYGVYVLGGGRALQVCHSEDNIYWNNGDTFVPADVGLTIYLSDGNEYIITEYLNTSHVKVSVSAPANDCSVPFLRAATIKPLVGNFSRKFNDTTLDRGGGVARISLEDRIFSGFDQYIPRRNFDPLPSRNIGLVSGGFMVAVDRDSVDYYYCQTERRYSIGYYKEDQQFGELPSRARFLVKFPSLAVFLLSNKTRTLPLNVSEERGNTEIGEIVRVLPKPIESSDEIGVVHWQSVQYKGAARIWAVTSEPAFRYFDGHSWSQENFAIDQRTGDDAVQKILNSLVHEAGITSKYHSEDGYILWAQAWEEGSDDVIINTGGVMADSDDVWVDNGGALVTGDNVINNVGGNV